MFMFFHALWVEDAISYLLQCTSAVCHNMGVFKYQSKAIPASLALFMFLLMLSL